MAVVSRVAGLSMAGDASHAMFAPQVYHYTAGEPIETGQPVYLKASDLKLYKASGAAANEAAEVFGFAGRTVKNAGQKLTVYGPGARFGNFSGMTPKTKLYLSATPGELDTAPSTGGTQPIAFAINATDVMTGRWYF